MKRVKAWAVVDKRGCVIYNIDDEALVFRTKSMARENLRLDLEGERVVPVVIEIEGGGNDAH